jgi:hypothetical protein
VSQSVSNSPRILSLRDVSGLTEVCREAERFADGSGTLVSVELLGAGKTTLLDVLANRKNVGVIGGDRLIAGRPPGPELSENVVEELALTARNRDRVAVAMTLGD